jgi:hypothetical protein
MTDQQPQYFTLHFNAADLLRGTPLIATEKQFNAERPIWQNGDIERRIRLIRRKKRPQA